MSLIPLLLMLTLPPDAELVLEVNLPGDATVQTVFENPDGSYTMKIMRARRDYGGECLMVDIRDFDFLTLDTDGDTLALASFPSTDAFMLWDVLEMDDSAGYLLYGDYRVIPEDMGEPHSDWYFNDTFPYSAFQLTRVSMSGDTLWSMGWDDDSLARGLTARLLYDNSILALSEVYGPDGTDTAHLHLVDESGNLLWKQVIDDWDCVYPARIAFGRGGHIVVTHGRDVNRHVILDQGTGDILRIDTLPETESVYVKSVHRTGLGDVLVCQFGHWSTGDRYPATVTGEGELAVLAGLADDDPVGWQCPACDIDGTVWAFVYSGGWEMPLIRLAILDGPGTVIRTLNLMGLTGRPEPGYLVERGLSTAYDEDVEWDFGPVGSLQYTDDGRFILGINNRTMLEESETMGCVCWVVSVSLPLP